jgi:hypothetical protein
MDNVQKHNIYINAVELSISWEAASCSASEEFPSILQEPESSLLRSQKPATGPYLEPEESIPYHPKRGWNWLLIVFNVEVKNAWSSTSTAISFHDVFN